MVLVITKYVFPVLVLEQIVGPVLLASAVRFEGGRSVGTMQDGHLCECLFKDETNREQVMTHECWKVAKQQNGSFCDACGQVNGTCRAVILETAKQPSDAYCGDMIAQEVVAKGISEHESKEVCGLPLVKLVFILQFHLFNLRGTVRKDMVGRESIVETHYKVQNGSMSDGLEVATVIETNVQSGIMGIDLVKVRLHDKVQTTQEIPKNWIINSKGTACSDFMDLLEKQKDELNQCFEAEFRGSECIAKQGRVNGFANGFREHACPGYNATDAPSGPMQ
eukprot:CAMPEP_0172726168 /NCGR_PEP_ID=MMETSP1074-20121228/90074_1 /TAXON_ID=2916 /ORGANISM="Ceratium fusus, Strain PA161109" /LENGTH=278 /DNA_ID=CAMNT_0013553111 /DNA_START=90 /DNA_END=926 /DNA_ORIENTATION=-